MNRILWGAVLLIALASPSVKAQGIASGGLSGMTSFPILPWTPPASPRATVVHGNDADYVPSTFVTFDRAIAAGKVALTTQAPSVAEAAAEAKRQPKPVAKATFVQDNHGNLIEQK